MTFLPTPRRQVAHGNCGYFDFPGDLRPVGISTGAFTRNSDDLVKFMEIFYSQKYFDLTKDLPNLTFNTELFNQTLNAKRLRIGLIKDTEPAIGMCKTGRRALEEVQTALEKLGHEVFEVEIPSIEEHMNNLLFFIVNEVMPHLTTHWNENCDDIGGLGQMATLYNCHKYVPKTIAMLVKLLGQRRLSTILGTTARPDIDEFAHVVKQRNVHVDQVCKLFLDRNIDALITVPSPFPAFLSQIADDVGLAAVGARLAIYWQFPSASMPVTLVRDDEQSFEEKANNDIITNAINRSMNGSAGLPVGIEIITTPFQDEKAMAILKILEKQIKFAEKHPYPIFN